MIADFPVMDFLIRTAEAGFAFALLYTALKAGKNSAYWPSERRTIKLIALCAVSGPFLLLMILAITPEWAQSQWDEAGWWAWDMIVFLGVPLLPLAILATCAWDYIAELRRKLAARSQSIPPASSSSPDPRRTS